MQSDDELQAAIDSVHSAVLHEAEAVINSLALRQALAPESSRFVEYCNQLSRLVPDYAAPRWLKFTCESFGSQYTQNHSNDQKLSVFLTANHHLIQVPILIGEAALDLDRVFDEKREQFGVPELFETLVKQLEELIVEDVIEHRTVAEAIQRLKAVLAKNRNGSLAAVLLSMNYGQFVLDSFRGVLSANKYTKPFVESFAQQFAQAREAVDQAKQATEQETIRVLTHLKRLELFMDEHPEVKPTVAGYLPPPKDADAE